VSVAIELPRFTGFENRVFDAQASFRAIMDALANPGRIETIALAPEAPSMLALIGDAAQCPELASFAQGTLEYPDRSTTLMLQVESLETETGLTLSGPGIKETSSLCAAPLWPGFADQLRANRARFPQGVDLLFCAGNRIVGVPRSTHIEG